MAVVMESFALEGTQGRRWVIDPPSDPYGDGYIANVHVRICADGLTAETTATLEPEVRLAAFFAGLAESWRGWAGERSWTALENEMTIDARHDGKGHVTIGVTLRQPERAYAADSWSARVVFALEAGEQLAGVAGDIAALMGE